MQASVFLQAVEGERTIRRPPERRPPSQWAMLPPASKIFFGCRAWEPKYDATAHLQDPSGLYQFRSRRRNRPKGPCVCGKGQGRIIKRGSLWYCDGCAESGQDDLLPSVILPPCNPPKEQAAPERSLTRRERRRLKAG